MILSPLADAYDAVLLDLDGVVWVGDSPTERATDAVAALRAAGKALSFVTNDARHREEDFVQKLWRLGFQASAGEVVTVGAALQRHIADTRPEGGSAYVIGSQAIVDHVAAAGLRVVNQTDLASRADVVVVAGHEDFDYAELRTATQAAMRGAELIGAGRDANFPMPDGAWPGTGAILAAVEYACGRTAHSVGKPEPELVATAVERCGGGRALMVGDRVDADLGAASAAGIDGAIVLTGASSREDAERADPAPVAIAESLAALVLG